MSNLLNAENYFAVPRRTDAPTATALTTMRHTSRETKRRYQLGMVEQVREAMERANQQVYGDRLTIP
jgi:hypothetical protein